MPGELKITKGLLDRIINVHAKSGEIFSDIEAQHKHNKEEDLSQRRQNALSNMSQDGNINSNTTSNVSTTTTSSTKMKK